MIDGFYFSLFRLIRLGLRLISTKTRPPLGALGFLLFFVYFYYYAILKVVVIFKIKK